MKKGFGCERPECCTSTGIDESTTFGTGELDQYGFWEFPCKKCEEAWYKHLVQKNLEEGRGVETTRT